MVKNNQDGWLFGKSGSDEGVFPQNYVKELAII